MAEPRLNKCQCGAEWDPEVQAHRHCPAPAKDTVNRFALIAGENGDELVKHAQGDWVPHVVFDRQRLQLSDTQSALAAAGRQLNQYESILRDAAKPGIEDWCDECGGNDAKCPPQCWVRRAHAMLGLPHCKVQNSGVHAGGSEGVPTSPGIEVPDNAHGPQCNCGACMAQIVRHTL